MSTWKRYLNYPLDQVAWSLAVVLVVSTLLLIALGDHATARVQTFSWQERTIGADNTAFVMTFNRPMDPESVEANLRIAPPLPGRVSWAGRRMAYTLDGPIPYGETFEVTLPEARDRFFKAGDEPRFEAFAATFQSRDRGIVYIGSQGEETGRLVLVNFSQGGEPTLLTPSNLTVLDFEPYPLGDRLLFSAVSTTDAEAGNFAPILYAVTTGLQPEPPETLAAEDAPIAVDTAEAGILTPLLDNNGYQNLAFDLSPNGQVIVVQRINQANPDEFGPWLLREGETPEPLDTEPGGEFLIGPDNQTLLMLQGQGTAVVPLELAGEDGQRRTDPLDFLPEFGRIFDLSDDGTAAAMVDFNQNNPEQRFTESLVMVTNQGGETEFLNVTGSILSAQFDPTNRIIYVLASDLLPGEQYQEQPFLTAVNIETQASLELATFPPQSRVTMSISPDGLAAVIAVALPMGNDGNAELVQTILLPFFTTTEGRLSGMPAPTQLQVLPYVGTLPTWLP